MRVMMVVTMVMLTGAGFVGQQGLRKVAPGAVASVAAPSGPIVLPPLRATDRPSR